MYARAMTLLLLLSALLSALTGVGGSVRVPQAAVAMGSAIAVHAETRTARQAIRPQAVMPRLTDVARLPLGERLALAGTPLWTTRRRE